MTHEEVTKNIESQPVGRATLVVNDRCGDPSNYLYKLNYLALHCPHVVKNLAVRIRFADVTQLGVQVVTTEEARELVDKHYFNTKVDRLTNNK